jgi:ABC-type uncharacterized transport system substrate-binding protein
MRFPSLHPRNLLAAALAAGAGLGPAALTAHPHIFVDAGLTLVIEEGRVVSVEVTWLYDELYSLILMEDYDLDADFDLALTEEEVARTLGFDLDWSYGFEGGLVMQRDGAELSLGAPEPVSMELVGDGQLRTTHRRPVVDEGGAAPLVAQVFDPEFYVAFEMTGDMAAIGSQCETTLVRADLDAAYAGLEEAIDAIGGAVAAEDNFPAVGALFADRVAFDCAS